MRLLMPCWVLLVLVLGLGLGLGLRPLLQPHCDFMCSDEDCVHMCVFEGYYWCSSSRRRVWHSWDLFLKLWTIVR